MPQKNLSSDWDNIFKDYQKTGRTWGSLSEDIHPLFKDFIKQLKFKHKSVLDIGCGDGRYLQYLRSFGFKVNGIDSSETALKLTKKLLKKDVSLKCTDMYRYLIPENKYDLIISNSTIHHGRKRQVKRLINRIHSALIDGGRVFITLPDIQSAKKWNSFKQSKELEPGTFAPTKGPEKGLPHSFYTRQEVMDLFKGFGEIKVDLDERGRWVVIGGGIK